MYSKGLFGTYYPADSKVHDMSIIIKLLNFFLFILVMIGSKSLRLHLVILVILVLQILESKIPFGFFFNMFYGLRYIYVILIFIFASLNLTLELSIIYLLKFILITEYLALLTYTTSLSEFDYGIYKLLNPINFLNLNISYISLIIGNIFRFIPELIFTENLVLKSQASRGIDYNNSGLIGKYYAIVHSLKNTIRLTFKRMKEINSLAKLRIFDKNKRRTNLKTGNFSFYAFVLLIFHLLFLYLYILEVNLIWDI